MHNKMEILVGNKCLKFCSVEIALVSSLKVIGNLEMLNFEDGNYSLIRTYWPSFANIPKSLLIEAVQL